MSVDEGSVTAAQYDAMAAGYSAFNEVNAANAYYERPNTVALLGDVAGKDVLEVGCGAGVLTEWLVGQGARVRAFDVSPEMAALAVARLGDRAAISVHDLHLGLPDIASASQDVIVASLVLHYIEDWAPIFAEWRRLLRDGGFVVFSTHHPAWDWQNHSPDDYFAKLQVTETWTRAAQPYDVTFWRRPLCEMTRVIRAAGFVIDVLDEPEPVAGLSDHWPKEDKELRTRPFFLFFRLRARPAAWA